MTFKPSDNSGPTGTLAEVCLSQHHSTVVTVVTAPISLGWLTYPGDLLSIDWLAPDHEVLSGNTEATPTLQKDNLTQQSVPSMPQFPCIRWRHTLPKKAILYLHRSSGSLGFSEAWPQPAHTACKHRET